LGEIRLGEMGLGEMGQNQHNPVHWTFARYPSVHSTPVGMPALSRSSQ